MIQKEQQQKLCLICPPVSATSPNTSLLSDFGGPAQHKSQTENQQSRLRVVQQSTSSESPNPASQFTESQPEAESFLARC